MSSEEYLLANFEQTEKDWFEKVEEELYGY